MYLGMDSNHPWRMTDLQGVRATPLDIDSNISRP
jgi:hypothetical protein